MSLTNRFFIDEQRVGPYAMWHHQHHIEASGNETMMHDIITYTPPHGIFRESCKYIIHKKELERNL